MLALLTTFRMDRCAEGAAETRLGGQANGLDSDTSSLSELSVESEDESEEEQVAKQKKGKGAHETYRASHRKARAVG